MAVRPGRALALFFCANLFDYMDRQVVYAVFPLIQAEFGLADAQLGLLASAFMLVYMTASPIIGPLGDRWNRHRILAACIAIWSLATTASGLARTFGALLMARAAVGIAEAGYVAVAPAVLSDHYAPERRGRALATFYTAIPVGSALGYLLGGLVSGWWGWRSAFFVLGLPGLLLAALTAREPEPRRGAAESGSGARDPVGLGRLLTTPTFLLTTLAMAALTFVLGALAAWMPTYLVRVKGLNLETANTLFGAMTVVAGLGGTLAGGWLGDRLLARSRAAHLWVSAAGVLAGVPFVLVAILSGRAVVYLPAIFAAECLLFLNTGPLNAVIVNVAPTAIRATACAINIFAIHALGDAISPWLVGRLSDQAGLTSALLWTMPAALVASAAFCLAATRTLPADLTRTTCGP